MRTWTKQGASRQGLYFWAGADREIMNKNFKKIAIEAALESGVLIKEVRRAYRQDSLQGK